MQRLALVLAMVLPLALSSCGDSTGPGLSGTYTLQSVNGDPVPAFTSEGQVLDGFVRFNSDGTFRASHTYAVVGASQEVIIDGTYERFGSDLELTFEDPDGPGTAVAFATIEGNTLFIEDAGEIWVYVR